MIYRFNTYLEQRTIPLFRFLKVKKQRNSEISQ